MPPLFRRSHGPPIAGLAAFGLPGTLSAYPPDGPIIP
jgi:hypothetical protein